MPSIKSDEFFSSKKPNDGSILSQSPLMVTRSQCSGECPSNSLAGRSSRRTTRLNNSIGSEQSPYDPHLHQHHHHQHHHHLHDNIHQHASHYMVEPRRGLAELSGDEDFNHRKALNQRLARDDESSDEEITLIRRTTNKIMTSIEISSRKMNSVHPTFTKLAFISLLLPVVVFFFSCYYYDHQPKIISSIQQQTPQQAALLSSSSPTSPGQPLPSHFSQSNQLATNSRSFDNLTLSCPLKDGITILNKRLDRLEQLVHRLTEENTKLVLKLTEENTKRINSVSDIISHKIQEAIEMNKQDERNKKTLSVEEIAAMIKQAIYLDKTGKADYALESMGGSIVTSRCSETYDPYGIKYSIWGIPIWYTSNSPRTVIQASMTPGECWAFPGSIGNVTIKLSARIIPSEFSYEHISKELSRDGNIKSAPKAIQVRGLKDENDYEGVLLGNYDYLDNDQSLQTFQVQNAKGRPFNFISLIVLSNQGHPEYTCLYRFRVHGRKV